MANVLVQDGAGVAKYLKATGDGSNGDPFVVQHLMGSGATDDAAAAGELYPIAGVYQATNDEVNAGDVGRVRMSARRALIVGSDRRVIAASISSVDYSGDMAISLTSEISGYSALVTGNLGPEEIGADPFWLRIPMIEWGNGAAIFLYNLLDVSLTVALRATFNPITNWSNLATVQIDTATLTAGSRLIFAPHAAGTTTAGVSWRAVPAMLCSVQNFVLQITPASDPTSGYMIVSVGR